MRRPVLCTLLVLVQAILAQAAAPTTPLEPFKPDEQTVLLYHFDEGQGTIAKDSSRFGYDGQIRGATWRPGKFDQALEFDGRHDTVFREVTEAIEGLKAITVECWFKQENPEGRQFLIGKDVTIHFDLAGGTGTSLSLYHQGGAVANSEGFKHRQVAVSLGPVRPGRWHHLAGTYDGRQVSFFFDGVLASRSPGPKDFSLGVRSRGLWIGSYVGGDYWFSGRIDEVRVSRSVRYDPEAKLAVGGRIFELPGRTPVGKTVRTPRETGTARLRLALEKSFGGNAAGWVYLKPPGKKAAIVGQFDLAKTAVGKATAVELDVSDEWIGDGVYLVGLESAGPGYYRLTSASLTAGGKIIGQWTGRAASRRTFQPPVLVAIEAQRQGPAVSSPLALASR